MATVDGTNDGDTLYGTSDTDTITARNGDDSLVGFGGADRLDGGNGVDTAFYFDSTAGVAVNLTTGRGLGGSAQGDTLVAIERLWGSSYNDTLTGNDGANSLSGSDGNDVLSGGNGTDAIDGGSGDDILKGGGGADYLVGGSGIDTADYSQSGGNVSIRLWENYAYAGDAVGDTLISIENVTGTVIFDYIEGDNGVNVLRGNAGDDSLQGYAGADTLIGGEGDDQLYNYDEFGRDTDIDTMIGGTGDDLYQVGAGDIVVESAGEGYDRIETWVSFLLPGNVEELDILDSAGVADGAGNTLDNTIKGNASANRLDGGSGADTMEGKAGNDIYMVDNAGDVVIEEVAPGTLDWIATSVSYTIAASVSIEILTTTSSGGSAAIDLTGNQFGQTITGNAGANRLNGMAGADTMKGLGGNDTYYVDNAADRVIEDAGQGTTDWVATSLSYGLASGIEAEKLSTTSSGATTAINLMGNEFAQIIVGNAGANIISGKAGNDTLTGLGGPDTFVFDTALNSTANVDRITDYNVAADTIWLQNGIFTQIVGTGTLTAAQFLANTTGLAQDANDRIIYESDTGKLFYDVNGNAAGGSFHFATLGANLALTSADFTVV